MSARSAPVLPAASVARTRKVYEPSVSTDRSYVRGDVQAAQSRDDRRAALDAARRVRARLGVNDHVGVGSFVFAPGVPVSVGAAGAERSSV